MAAIRFAFNLSLRNSFRSLSTFISSLSINRVSHVKYVRCFSTVVPSPKIITKRSSVLKFSDYTSNSKLWTENTDKKLKDNIRHSFNIENLSDSVLKLYNVKYGSTKEGESVLVFPWSQGVRTHAVNGDHSNNSLSSSNDTLGIFGWNTINIVSSKHLIITDNELDAMAAHQATNYQSIAINIDQVSSSLSPQVVKHFEQMDSIYIWCQKDDSWVTEFTKQLKCSCFKISSQDSTFKSALDTLNSDLSVSTIINEAQPMSHKKILSFKQLKDDVYMEFLNSEKVAGVKWNRFSNLTKLLKGFRCGELTILTGPTGCGKTTLMSELSLDLCQQGVPTLWGSFEISNVRLIKTLLRQLSGLNLDVNLNKYQSWADKFQSLPFQFMGFHGQADLTHVLNAMHYSIKLNGIQHVIIDNLQFMVGIKSRGFDDSFHAQNAAIAEFRHFATSQHVHVTIIVHPRKEGEDKLLSTASIFGTAKAGQEADNVLILQAQPNRDKFLQVTKNRFSGDLGCMPLKFHRDSLTFSGVFQSLVQNEVKIRKSTLIKKSTAVSPLEHVTLNAPKSPSFLKPLIPSAVKTPHTTL